MNTHLYIGPTTKWGLKHGDEGTIVGRSNGGYDFRRKDGKRFTVGRGQVTKIEPRPSS